MAQVKYYSEEELIEKFQSGEYGWLDFVNHHSPEWAEEYEMFVKEHNLEINDVSAESFVNYKGDQLERAMGSDA
jgi:hypothetical protein